MKLHRLAQRMIACAWPNCARFAMRVPRRYRLDTVPDLNKSTAMAATGQTKAAAAVQVKLSSQVYYIDHPDSELVEQLMADALGVADRDAMTGIVRQ